MSEDKDPVQLVGKISAAMEQMKADNVKVNAALKESVEKTGADAAAALKVANEVAEKIQSAAASILDMEQKLAEGVNKGKASVQTLGDMVIKSEAFKQFAAGNTGKFRIEANTITGQEGSPAENADTLVQADRVAGIVPGAFRQLKLLDVLPQGNTTSNAVEFTRELLFTNAAAEAQEGAAKAESTLTFELKVANVRTVAHIIKASKQILDDAPALKSYVDTRMRYGVDLKTDYQLLRGAGTSQTLAGMLASGNYTSYTPVTGNNALDTLNHMIQTVEEADYMATAIIMHPADFYAIQRLKRVSGDTSYTVGDPSGIMAPMLWGKPVVVTSQQNSGYATVGALDIAYQVFNRQGTVVEMFEQDSDNAQKNLVTIRGEKRLCLAGYRPVSVRHGALSL